MNERTVLKAVIFDWAGTMVDFGSCAPMGVMVETFARFGIEITIDEVRRPMGLPKRDHIRALLAMPRIGAAWQGRWDRPPSEADVDAVYDVFLPLGREAVARLSEPIPGAAEAAAAVRARGLRIGSTTGYTRDVLQPIAVAAAARGYAPEIAVCAGDVAEGRPSPLMMYKCFVELGVWPAHACVKVDDTVPGIAEGLAAGSWTVGVTDSGNLVGLPPDVWSALSEEERAERRHAAAAALRSAGAHLVIDTVADLPACLDRIEARLAAGERP
jgi:phosphonoacetaldehyde hydrolase